jgi:hypothetical protein
MCWHTIGTLDLPYDVFADRAYRIVPFDDTGPHMLAAPAMTLMWGMSTSAKG